MSILHDHGYQQYYHDQQNHDQESIHLLQEDQHDQLQHQLLTRHHTTPPGEVFDNSNDHNNHDHEDTDNDASSTDHTDASTDRTSTSTSTSNNHDRDDRSYLLYYSHSGFANQLIGMEHAAYLAIATNRTLVLPPVLPHHTSTTSTSDLKFSAFQPRFSGIKCDPYDEYQEFITTVQQDVHHVHTSASDSDPNTVPSFPSFQELFDFHDIFQKTGLRVIDTQEFAKDPQHRNTGTRSTGRETGTNNAQIWCKGEKSSTPDDDGHEMEQIMVPQCHKSHHLSFPDLVTQFQNTCGSDRQIAVIGSAFVMLRKSEINRDPTHPIAKLTKPISLYFQHNLIPTRKVLSLLHQIHSKLPEGYKGVHIRFRDWLVVDDCDDPLVKEVYQQVFQDLVGQQQQQHQHQQQKNVTITNPTTHAHVLIGNGNRAALTCFRHHAHAHAQETGYQYHASTMNDVIDSDETLQKMVDEIKSEKSTIYLLLDQILIALAETIAFGKVDTTAGTFHSKIKQWHLRRGMILEQMRVAGGTIMRL